MDKLSEHAIRMLEIADKPYRNEYGMINKDLQDRHDMAQAVYDLILQVQMLKMADRKVSEIPTDCDTCRYAGECDWEPWQECPYEPKTEPQTDEFTEEEKRCIEAFTEMMKATNAYGINDKDKDEPQTDCPWK